MSLEQRGKRMSKSNYEYITDYNALNYTEGRNGHHPELIVIHHWGALGQRFENVINWFCENPNVETSAHYVVEAGKVACIVDLDDTAWHAGRWDYNLKSIGIECRPEATDADYMTVAALVADIWRIYGKLPLIGHRDVPNVPTFCPGLWNVERITAMADRIYNNDSPSSWAKEPWDRATKNKIVDGKNPKRPATREEVVVICDRYFKLMNDGI